jgi:hypothetical protein
MRPHCYLLNLSHLIVFKVQLYGRAQKGGRLSRDRVTHINSRAWAPYAWEFWIGLSPWTLTPPCNHKCKLGRSYPLGNIILGRGFMQSAQNQELAPSMVQCLALWASAWPNIAHMALF